MNALETSMALQIQALRQDRPKMPMPVNEYRFHPLRKWRFDFAWPDHRIAVEVEGGSRTYGRHNRAGGFEKDCEKYNAAALLGWRVFRFTSAMVQDGRAYQTLAELWPEDER